MPVIIFVFFLTFPCVTIIFSSPGINFFMCRLYYYVSWKLFLSITQIILRLRIIFLCAIIMFFFFFGGGGGEYSLIFAL